MIKISLIVLSSMYFILYGTCKDTESFAYWLPKTIIQRDANNSNIQITTSVAYNEQFEIISITKSQSFNQQVYTAFIDYNDQGLVSTITQTSSNPLIKEKVFRFVYHNTRLTQIKVGDTYISVSYNKKQNSYSFQKNNHLWQFDFDEKYNLKSTRAGNFIIVKPITDHLSGVYKDIRIQPVLFLIQDQLEAINTLSFFLYNTKWVTSFLYEDAEFSLKNRLDEYGNIAQIMAYSNTGTPLEFEINYEMHTMRL